MITFTRTRYILQVVAVSLLGGGVALLAFKPEPKDESEQRPSEVQSPRAKSDFPLRLDDDPDIQIGLNEESEEYLLALIALEETIPTLERSPGYLYSTRANRYVAASRMLTNRALLQAEAQLQLDARDKVLRLRGALERFAEAFMEAADAHHLSAAGAYRSVRMEMCDIEKRSRLEIFSQLRDEPDARARLELRSHRFPIEPLAARIRQSEWYVPEEPAGRGQAEIFAREAQEALVATLPELSAALAEWPPDFSQSIQTELRRWLDDFLPVPDPSTPR
jgi:hypothetical protein